MHKKLIRHVITIFILLYTPYLSATSQKVKVGIDRLMEEQYSPLLRGKRIGLITNQTGVNGSLQTTVEILKANAKAKGYTLVALFAPEHGIDGMHLASKHIQDSKDPDGLPIYSIYGRTSRPTSEMLREVNLLIYDIQDIGTRSYTYISTMFYAMEEAAKSLIPFIVLDRPNPINGLTVDGNMLNPQWRSITGYINIPYCHGMTTGELARFFNEEYQVGCKLEVIPMQGWKREMTFTDTGLPWIPTSPYIPESTTPFFYPTTGILGELQLINLGIGYTLPFKIVGAPWINAKQFASKLNAQHFPGVHFQPFYFSPAYGRYARENCQGVLIVITDHLSYKPVSTQYLLIGILKSLYPTEFKSAIAAMQKNKKTLCNLLGTEEAYRIIVEDKHIAWKLCALHKKERVDFILKRKKYLLYTEKG